MSAATTQHPACSSGNATPPTPAIAPGLCLDPRRAAEDIANSGPDPRLGQLVPGFDAPFFQAGLAGYSDAAMRLVARRHGCPLCVTEALLDRGLLGGGRGFAKADLDEIAANVPGGAHDHPLVGQIIGSEPSEMAAAALTMIEQGARANRRPIAAGGPARAHQPADHAQRPARTFAAIDINLACPVKKIRNKSRGGHWLAQPDGAIAIIEAVRQAVPASIPVTLKLRRSFDDTPAMAECFDRILDTAFDIGIAWATVHARSVQQKYIGPSRWDLLRDIVARYPDRLILGSGDIWTAGDIFAMIHYTGVKAVAVARGCIGNPWIFRQARDLLAGRDPTPPTLAQQRAVLEDHFALAMGVNAPMRKTEAHTARCMRKFAIRFAAFHPHTSTVRKRFIAVTTLDDWHEVLDAHYPTQQA